MNIRINKRENPFAQIDKTPINDTSLSAASLGLLVYLLSKPDGWKPKKNELLARFKGTSIKTTINMIESALRELREAGYAKLVYIKGPGGKIVGSEYIISELPSAEVAISSDLGIFSDLGRSPAVEDVANYTNNELSNNNNELLSNNNETTGKSKILVAATQKLIQFFELYPDTWKIISAEARKTICEDDFYFEVQKWLSHNEENLAIMQNPQRYLRGGAGNFFLWLSRAKIQPNGKGQANHAGAGSRTSNVANADAIRRILEDDLRESGL